MSALLGARVALVGFTGTGKSTIAACLIDELHRRGLPATALSRTTPST